MKRKIVINRCRGMFGLSRRAKLAITELDGINVDMGYSKHIHHAVVSQHIEGYSFVEGMNRHHPHLVKVVEELGDSANGLDAKLVVRVIPGTQYYIEQFNGWEMLRTPEEMIWQDAGRVFNLDEAPR